jgi:hypothetical protein
MSLFFHLKNSLGNMKVEWKTLPVDLQESLSTGLTRVIASGCAVHQFLPLLSG